MRVWLMQSVWLVAIATVLGYSLTVSPQADAESVEVDVNTGEVEHDGDLNASTTQTTQAESVGVGGGGNYEIKSVEFNPPTNWSFKEFDAGTYVDIIPPSIDSLPADADPDSSSAIRVWWYSQNAPESADDFGLRAEGNLTPPGGTGGSPKEFHWAAKVEAKVVTLDIGIDEPYLDYIDDSVSVPVYAGAIVQDPGTAVEVLGVPFFAIVKSDDADPDEEWTVTWSVEPAPGNVADAPKLRDLGDDQGSLVASPLDTTTNARAGHCAVRGRGSQYDRSF